MGRTFRNRKKRRKENATTSIRDGFDQTHVAKYAELMRWMVCNGFTGACLQPAYFKDTGRGLKATKNILPGDSLLCIPRKLLITTTTVMNSELGSVIRRYNCAITPEQMLAVYLLFEDSKGTSSFWFAYLALLPPTFSTPAFYSQEELQLLPSSIYSHAKAHIEAVSNAFKQLAPFFKLLHKHYPDVMKRSNTSYERFRWAWYVVNTRCVYMQQDNQHDNCVLAPFLDLLNHSPSAKIDAGFDCTADCYVIKTATSYKKWQQVFICYGPHGNDQLLLEYGFVVPNNHHSSVKFDIDDVVCCMDDNTLLYKKLEIINKCHLGDSLLCGWDGLSWCLVTALKIMCMDSQEIDNWKEVYTSSGMMSHGSDTRPKQLAMRLLTKHMHSNQSALQVIEHTEDTEDTELQADRSWHLPIINTFIQERIGILQIALKELE